MKPVMLVVVMATLSLMVSVKVCVASLPRPLLAFRFSVSVPPAPAGGVPASTPLVSVSQLGSVVVVLKVGAGKPLAASAKLPAVPTAKVVAAALVKAGASPTESVKFCVESVPTPLLAFTTTT